MECSKNRRCIRGTGWGGHGNGLRLWAVCLSGDMTLVKQVLFHGGSGSGGIFLAVKGRYVTLCDA